MRYITYFLVGIVTLLIIGYYTSNTSLIDVTKYDYGFSLNVKLNHQQEGVFEAEFYSYLVNQPDFELVTRGNALVDSRGYKYGFLNVLTLPDGGRQIIGLWDNSTFLELLLRNVKKHLELNGLKYREDSLRVKGAYLGTGIKQ